MNNFIVAIWPKMYSLSGKKKELTKKNVINLGLYIIEKCSTNIDTLHLRA